MTDTAVDVSGYIYTDGALNPSHEYLMPSVLGILERLDVPAERKRLFELGCGNGAVAHTLSLRGYDVAGIDASADGIRNAQLNYPRLPLHMGSVYDARPERHGLFPIVLSLEVVEHLYAPRRFAKNLFDLVEPGGTAIVSTPYHGYWKNLALALTGRFDRHFTALWDHGHIKFWSIATLRRLLEEAGFRSVEFHRVGRVRFLAKSMIAVAKKE